MRNTWGLALLAPLALAVLTGCAAQVRPAPFPARTEPPWSAEPPAAPREFRAVWVATVANIDWPSTRGAPAEVQKAEARAVIAQARSLGLNALILQVRPAADALYASRLEPWSEYLTGEQGKPPDPFYDPLAFWIEEAHRAGLELHAWFNPYRAQHPTSKSRLAPGHVANTHPDLVKTYGEQLWLDPGEPGSAQHALAVILDVVRRYDVDGVHLDDYFYPYPILDEEGKKVDFPDDPSWQKFLSGGGTLSRADWRRRNVDGFIERLYREVHLEKPRVRVGVSPFGLGRPDRRPPDVTGFSQYDEIYANAELWLEQGWMDYLAPQLYWKMSSTGQPFSPLLDYWHARNPKGRHIWPGLFTSRAGPPDPWPAEEIAGQIRLTRSRSVDAGHAHFSVVALKKDYGGITGPLASVYSEAALVPASDWLGEAAPPAPSVRLQRSATDPSGVQVQVTSGDVPWLLAVWASYGQTWRFFTFPGGSGRLPAQAGGQPLGSVYASAVGRTGLESPRVAAKDARN